MDAAARVDHEAGHHRVEERPLHVDAVVVQDVHVVLQVLAALRDAVVLERRPERGDHRLEVGARAGLGEQAPLGRPRLRLAAVHRRVEVDRHVPGGAGEPREREAHELRPVRVDGGRLGVHAEPAEALRQRERACELLHLLGRVDEHVLVLAQAVPGLVFEALEAPLEVELDVQPAQRVDVGRLPRVKSRRCPSSGTFVSIVTSSRDRRAWSANSWRFSESFFCLSSGACGQHRLHVAVGLDELSARFGTDAGHPGDVVRAVPHQAHHVDDLLGRHAELLDSVSSGPISATSVWPGFMTL